MPTSDSLVFSLAELLATELIGSYEREDYQDSPAIGHLAEVAAMMGSRRL